MNFISDTPYLCPVCKTLGKVIERKYREVHLICTNPACKHIWGAREVTGN
jgi:hypothetical protein